MDDDVGIKGLAGGPDEPPVHAFEVYFRVLEQDFGALMAITQFIPMAQDVKQNVVSLCTG